jgi:cytochrome c oxidase cbb3-type subunit 3
MINNNRPKLYVMLIPKKTLILAAALLLPLGAFAEATASDGGYPFNPMLIGLASLVIVLLLAIGILATVLKSLSAVYREKLREQKRAGLTKALALILLLVPAGNAFAADPGAEAVAPAVTTIAGMSAETVYLLAGIIVFEVVVLVALLVLIRTMVKLIVARPDAVQAAATGTAKKRVPFWDRFNKAVEIEKEADIMLDHNYDGIRELDNSLPPWWKYGFYVTIVVGVIYMWYYHGGGNGPSSHEEYIASVKAAEEAHAAYLASSKDKVDENTVTMGDAASITSGATLYQTHCAACHANDGGGGVGPNLTDDYWLHGGSIGEVFASIKYGWPDKGMKSWKNDLSPRQIADLSSFIKSLRGTAPAAPKEPQGTLHEDEPAGDGEGAAAADTTMTVAAQ